MITVLHIDALVAEFAVMYAQTIAAIPRVQNPARVIAVLQVAGIRAKITVFGMGDAIGEIGVAVTDGIGEQIVVRHAITQLRHLLEKGTTEVNIPTVGQRIPLIPQPYTDVVHGKKRFGRMHGNNPLVTQAAGSIEQRALIAECKAALQSALRTESRRRNQFLLPVKHRRNFFVKREIIGSDVKGSLTLVADLLHGGSIE